MPNSRQTSVIASPSRTRATKRRRSSITELAFHGISTSRQKAKSVTHVSGTKCHLCLSSTLAIFEAGSNAECPEKYGAHKICYRSWPHRDHIESPRHVWQRLQM